MEAGSRRFGPPRRDGTRGARDGRMERRLRGGAQPRYARFHPAATAGELARRWRQAACLAQRRASSTISRSPLPTPPDGESKRDRSSRDRKKAGSPASCDPRAGCCAARPRGSHRGLAPRRYSKVFFRSWLTCEWIHVDWRPSRCSRRRPTGNALRAVVVHQDLQSVRKRAFDEESGHCALLAGCGSGVPLPAANVPAGSPRRAYGFCACSLPNLSPPPSSRPSRRAIPGTSARDLAPSLPRIESTWCAPPSSPNGRGARRSRSS